jgi:DNA-binding transcriptional ArsR family regulator
VLDVEVIDDPAAAVVALDPVRARLLAALGQPASAAELAATVGLSRQKVNYHLHALEAHGLVTLAGERRWGGLTERRLVATATSYVVSPAALGAVASDPARSADRLSARYLVALAARVVREVGGLARRADAAGKRVATLGIDTEIAFASAADRAAFAAELAGSVTALTAKYHAAGGRPHRLVVAAYPKPGPGAGPEPRPGAGPGPGAGSGAEPGPGAGPGPEPGSEPRPGPGPEEEQDE